MKVFPAGLRRDDVGNGQHGWWTSWATLGIICLNRNFTIQKSLLVFLPSFKRCISRLKRFKLCDIIIWSLPARMYQSCLSLLISHWVHEKILMSAFRWLTWKKGYGKPLLMGRQEWVHFHGLLDQILDAPVVQCCWAY